MLFCLQWCNFVCVCVSVHARVCPTLILVMSFAVVSLVADESAIHLYLPPPLILFLWIRTPKCQWLNWFVSQAAAVSIRDVLCAALHEKKPNTHVDIKAYNKKWLSVNLCKYKNTHTPTKYTLIVSAVGWVCSCCGRRGVCRRLLIHSIPMLSWAQSLFINAHSQLFCYLYFIRIHSGKPTHIFLLVFWPWCWMHWISRPSSAFSGPIGAVVVLTVC